MFLKFHFAAALGLLLIVLVIFVSPAVDLPVTALRSQQASIMLLLSITIWACGQVRFDWIAPVRHAFACCLARPASVSGPSSLTGILLC